MSPLYNATIVSVLLRPRWFAISKVRFLYGLPTYVYIVYSACKISKTVDPSYRSRKKVNSRKDKQIIPQ